MVAKLYFTGLNLSQIGPNREFLIPGPNYTFNLHQVKIGCKAASNIIYQYSKQGVIRLLRLELNAI